MEYEKTAIFKLWRQIENPTLSVDAWRTWPHDHTPLSSIQLSPISATRRNPPSVDRA